MPLKEIVFVLIDEACVWPKTGEQNAQHFFVTYNNYWLYVLPVISAIISRDFDRMRFLVRTTVQCTVFKIQITPSFLLLDDISNTNTVKPHYTYQLITCAIASSTVFFLNVLNSSRQGDRTVNVIIHAESINNE